MNEAYLHTEPRQAGCSSEQTNLELINRYKRGELSALSALLKSNHDLIVGRLLKLGANYDDVADLAQEVQIRIWKNLHKLRDARSFRAWICQISANVLHDQYRRTKQKTISLDEPMHADSDESRELEDNTAVPHEQIEREEMLIQLTRTLQRIPEPYRKALIMREVMGHTYEEISSKLSVERGTVKSRISRARAKVRLHMKPYLTDCA